jgi:hypothetical protein
MARVGSTVYVYLNNALVATLTSVGTCHVANNFHIGCRNYGAGNSQWWPGMFDECWLKAATCTDVAAAAAADYNSGAGDWYGSHGYENALAEVPCTPFVRTVLDDADAATARATLGAGTGNGNVTGAASATAGNLAALDATGKILSDSGKAASAVHTRLHAVTSADDHTVTNYDVLFGAVAGAPLPAAFASAVINAYAPPQNVWHLQADGTDTMGNANLGVIGSPTYVAGKYGNGIVLAGAEALSYAGSPIDWSQDFAFPIWFKMPASPDMNENVLINASDNSGNWSVFIETYRTSLYLMMAGPGWYRNMNLSGALAANTWYHLLLVRIGTTLYVYLNSVSQGTLASLGTLYSITQFWLGCAFTGSYNFRFFNGMIDEPMTWQKTCTDVAALATALYQGATGDYYYSHGYANALAEVPCTPFARTVLDDADAATARATLGLGGAAVLNVGTGAGTVAAGDDSRFILPTVDCGTPTSVYVSTYNVDCGTP